MTRGLPQSVGRLEITTLPHYLLTLFCTLIGKGGGAFTLSFGVDFIQNLSETFDGGVVKRKHFELGLIQFKTAFLQNPLENLSPHKFNGEFLCPHVHLPIVVPNNQVFDFFLTREPDLYLKSF